MVRIEEIFAEENEWNGSGSLKSWTAKKPVNVTDPGTDLNRAGTHIFKPGARHLLMFVVLNPVDHLAVGLSDLKHPVIIETTCDTAAR